MSKNKLNLTTDEKIRLIIGKNGWHNEDLEGRLPIVMLSDGPVGVRHPRDLQNLIDQKAEPSLAYPCFEALSQTWNLDLAFEMGRAIGNDCIEKGIDVILGPGVNIKRLPTNGRNFEYLSEDPLVAGLFGREYIKGVQSTHVGACLKHFAVNSSEEGRNYRSMEVDERTLREIYLRPFEIACEAKPWGVMCAYNRVNGVKMAENKALFTILRKDFDFDGLIMSDWGAVFDPAASLKAGLDLEMPYSKEHIEDLEKCDKEGLLDIEALDKAANHVEAFATLSESEKPLRKIDLTAEERIDIAERIEEEGAVLLKNYNGALPLKKDTTLALCGAGIQNYVYGGGSSEVTPLDKFVRLDDALNELGFETKVAPGVEGTCGTQSFVTDERASVLAAECSDSTIIALVSDKNEQSEGRNRTTLALSPEQNSLVHLLAAHSKKSVVIIYSGAPVEMSEWINEVDAVLWASYPGEKGNQAIAKILAGLVNPSGKTTETFPLSLKDVEAENSYHDYACDLYSEGLKVGYRQFVTDGTKPLFPFGFGLSYTTFSYSGLQIEVKREGVEVSFLLANTGNRAGKEVVQLYVGEPGRLVFAPAYELQAFAKVSLKAGESRIVSFTLGPRAFSHYSTSEKKWVMDHTTFEIMIGSSSEDIILRKTINA